MSHRRRHSIHRESEESFVNHATAAIEDYLLAVISSITKSVDRCPQVMRRVLRNIQVKVRDKWPEEMYEVSQRSTILCQSITPSMKYHHNTEDYEMLPEFF